MDYFVLASLYICYSFCCMHGAASIVELYFGLLYPSTAGISIEPDIKFKVICL
jgi:hypothetical protein